MMCKYEPNAKCDIDDPNSPCAGCEVSERLYKDNEVYRCAIRPCKYDRYSPCENCGKCYEPEEDDDPDREYELKRDEGRL